MIIIVLGSKTDLDWANSITAVLKDLGVDFKIIVGSAHKTPEFLLKEIRKLDNQYSHLVYIAVAGRSNALGGFIDAHTTNPVISCPPKSQEYGGMDILSSLRMPSGIASMVVMDGEQAALAAIKIMATSEADLKIIIENYQNKSKEKVISANTNFG